MSTATITGGAAEERLQKLRERVAWAEAKVARMETLLGEMKRLSEQHQDILWHKSAQSGICLFEATMHLERETGIALHWLKKERGNLDAARREAGLED